MKTAAFKLVVVFLFLLAFSGGCTSSRGEGLAIYLTRDDVPPTQMNSLSHVNLADQPFICLEEIVSYNSQTHEMKLTPGAYSKISELAVPVRGRSFLVCVDKAPVYWGAFWTPISSIGFDGVTIWKPLGSQRPPLVTFELGYPSPSFYGGNDPRNDPAILKSLKQSGKLVAQLSLADVAELPASMKGYELYSWLQDGQWHFTLITGTNRNKTLDEIVAADDFVSESGWVKVTVAGAEALQKALSKLPKNEFVTWLADGRGVTGQGQVTLEMPPQATSDLIREYAAQLGIDLQMVSP